MDLLRARRIEMESGSPPAAVLERLRGLVANWRRSTLAAQAVPADIYGWSIDERGGQLIVRPRSYGFGAPLGIFEGRVQPSPSGSSISGEIRLHPWTRVFLIAVVALAAVVPVGAFMQSVSGEGGRSTPVGKIAGISAVLVAAALLLVDAGFRLLARNVRFLLAAAAQADRTE